MGMAGDKANSHHVPCSTICNEIENLATKTTTNPGYSYPLQQGPRVYMSARNKIERSAKFSPSEKLPIRCPSLPRIPPHLSHKKTTSATRSSKTPFKNPSKNCETPVSRGSQRLQKKNLEFKAIHTGSTEDSNNPAEEAAVVEDTGAATAIAAVVPEQANPRPACSAQPATPSSTPQAA